MRARSLASWIAGALFVSGALPAAAETGVSEERVSLPDGPGSIGGVGENLQVEGNQGSMRLTLPVRVPRGFPGVTPQVGLSYSSEGGQSVVGIGWSFETPYIERMTSRGLPAYSTDDLFAADGSDQLVRISARGGQATYRARYEREFVRYTWVGGDDGRAGYFTAEYPDGRITYYGADRNGNAVASARVTHPNGGVFRYLAVETVDPFGHRLTYGYTVVDGHPLVDTIGYLHNGANSPRFSVRFVYEARPDPISNGKPGFELRLTQRLSQIRVISGTEQIRAYALAYETVTVSGGMSRLRTISETGRGGEVYPVRQSYAYSRALGGTCTTNCEKPFVVDMGTLSGGVDFRAGAATLIDINGDSLPDVLDTTGGTHTFYPSRPSADGRPSFTGSPRVSTSSTSAFQLGSPNVQVLDVDGNGFTDMISARTGAVLCNDGSGDWRGTACAASGFGLDLEDDPTETGESDPYRVRFFDYDNDKRIDLLRTPNAGTTEVRRITDAGGETVGVEPIGAVFDESPLQLADINGDGLQDAVQIVSSTQLQYRLNLGRGTWTTGWRTMAITGLGDAQRDSVQVEDINGDGLDDLALVNADVLRYWLNRNGTELDTPVTVTSQNLASGSLPETTDTTTVLFADMNGNGSTDVVWITSSGNVRFLDLFPVKPNLLARVENGIGMVQEITYGTALAELARDGTWAYRLNLAMNVVKSVDMWVTATGGDGGAGLHDVTRYTYRDGYYDGQEKQFRGFATVERTLVGDSADSQQPGGRSTRYDVGATSSYFAGLQLEDTVYALVGDRRVPLRTNRTAYENCPIADVPTNGLTFPVRFTCAKTEWVIEQEGAPESEWATVRSELEYDGYGNVTRSSALGVVHMGSPENPVECRACADADDVACGPECTGDETYTETEYVTPGSDSDGKWFLQLKTHETTYGTRGGPVAETFMYYDGPDFEGLPLGRATQGKLTRMSGRVEGDRFIDRTRQAFDRHGNVVAALDPLGSPDDLTGHRRDYGYDDYGLSLTSVDVLLSDDEGPYTLRRDLSYEAAFNEVSESTEWVLVRGGEAQSGRDSTRYRYDAQGRLTRLIRQGDSEEAPSESYTYTLADPVSTVSIVRRSSAGAEPDSTSLRCADGRGRPLQNVIEVEPGRYIADGFRVLNSRGAAVRTYQPYELSSLRCSTSAPEGVAFDSSSYDPLYRTLEDTHPDADLYGTASVQRFEYAPLTRRVFDAEATADGARAGTPVTSRFDGEGRLIAIERLLSAAAEPAVTRLRFDSLDRMTGYIDAAGNVRTQEFDLLGRVARVQDPNAGVTTFTYDDASNVIGRTDGSGRTIGYRFDGANRLSATFDAADEANTRVTVRYDALADCAACTNAAGRRVEVSYPVVLGADTTPGRDRFGYDARRRKVYESRLLEGNLFETRREYDGLNRLTATTHPDGQTVTPRYDGADRITVIDGVVEQFAYDQRGLPAGTLFSNGVSTVVEHDARMRSSRHALVDAGGNALFDLTFSRDRVGNLLAAEDAVAASDTRLTRAFAQTYDAWNRTTEARVAVGGGDAETVKLGYDAIDNLRVRSSDGAGQLGELSYDLAQPNAVSAAGSKTYRYDESGNMSQRGEVGLDWDYRNRLVSATLGDSTLGEFGYGAEEERVIKREGGHVVYYVSPEFEVRDGISAVYPRRGRERLARLESDALATTLLPDLDEDERIGVTDAWLAQRDGSGQDADRLLAASARRVLYDAEEHTVFLHEDHVENVVAASGADGRFLGERTFYPYGAERVATAFVDEHGFTGQELDESTGLVHFRYRALDPELGRFVSADPAFEVLNIEKMSNLGEATTAFAFLGNRFGNAVDPTGLVSVFQKIQRVVRPFGARKKLAARNDLSTDTSKSTASASGGAKSVTFSADTRGSGKSGSGATEKPDFRNDSAGDARRIGQGITAVVGVALAATIAAAVSYYLYVVPRQDVDTGAIPTLLQAPKSPPLAPSGGGTTPKPGGQAEFEKTLDNGTSGTDTSGFSLSSTELQGTVAQLPDIVITPPAVLSLTPPVFNITPTAP